jgi:hypothetical protein
MASSGPAGWAPSTPRPWPRAEPAEVFALADALIRPDYKDRGLLDTAVVTVRFDWRSQ